MPSAIAVPPSPPAAALGATCTAAFPSAASITPAGAASTSSVHLPVSAPHGAAPTATASSTQEEMVSTVNSGAYVGKKFPNLFVYWIF